MKKISVRKLVEFILRHGDVESGKGAVMDAKAMEKGAQAHRKLQREGGAFYAAEVPLKYIYKTDSGMEIQVEGRADGIITLEDEKDNGDKAASYIIDEIKGTYANVLNIEEPDPLHLAQAYCYAFIWSTEHELEEITVRITYINLEEHDTKRFNQIKTLKWLQDWFGNLMEEYGKWLKWQEEWKTSRNDSISLLEFPYDYRKGQRKFVAAVYHAVKEGKKLFAQAPTGTGKTIATIFPSIKAMGEDMAEKIFYLTAKNLTATVAVKTLEDLRRNGLCLKSISLTSKEKICFLDKPECSPLICPYAKGHYDRINEALFTLINKEEVIDKDVLQVYAEEFKVCPFELQLDASEWLDLVIGDYNYLFDPNVSLKRFFSESKKDYIFLVDEAHNLVDRGRNMYSRSIIQSHYRELKKLLSIISPETARILNAVNKEFLSLKSTDGIKILPGTGGLQILFLRLLPKLDELLKTEGPGERRDKIMEVYFESWNFLNAMEVMDERYMVYTEPIGTRDNKIKILCVDPSGDLSDRTDIGRSGIFFSATLLPVDYYKKLLSSSAEKDLDMYVDSPFSADNRCILVADDVSSRYSKRNNSEYRRIAAYINSIIRARTGNYMAFFPSYAFMQNVFDIFTEEYSSLAGSGINVIIQDNNMTEEDRRVFLSNFKEGSYDATLGFCVLGGVFSEGIDLLGDRLIGVMIVGTGIPQISTETDLIRDWFDKENVSGFDYAYKIPGMNKVLQAGGRVIRTAEDKGIIALLDERFLGSDYKSLFPREWTERIRVSGDTVKEKSEDFWNKER